MTYSPTSLYTFRVPSISVIHPLAEPNVTAGELLAWYSEAGVDIALLDAPVDRFAEAKLKASQTKGPSAAQKQSIQQPPNQTPRIAPTISAASNVVPPNQMPDRSAPDANAVAKAQALADSCKTLAALKDAVEGFDGCNLKFTARSTVFCDGNPNAQLMIIGSAPGRDEDSQGLPFVGKTGQLLDRMLAAIGLDRTNTYLTNIMPWRPPGNRAPTPAETAICLPFIQKHIELTNPGMVLLFGGFCAETLLQKRGNVMSLRGKWDKFSIGDKEIPVITTLHPQYLLKTPTHKRLAWKDLQTLQLAMKSAKE